MKILENLLLDDNQEFEEETSKFRWICTQYPYYLEEINLETMAKSYHEIPFLANYNKYHTCTSSLPGNKLFCYRGSARWKNLNGIAFIIDENHKIEVLPSNISTIGFSATFYRNYVYMVGEIFLFRYDLAKRRWQKLKSIPCHGELSSCISINGMILLVWFDSAYIFVFDLWIFSFTALWPELEQDSRKLLCKSKNVVYLIDFSGLIWESDKNDIEGWNIIGDCKNLFVGTYPNKVFYKNSWYFRNDSELIVFNLDKKTVNKTNVRVLYAPLYRTFL